MIRKAFIISENMFCDLCKMQIPENEEFFMCTFFDASFSLQDNKVCKKYCQEKPGIDMCKTCFRIRISNDLKEEEKKQ